MTRLELHIDRETLGPIIDQAVDAAVRRMRDESKADDSGKMLLDKRQAAERMSISISTLDRLVRDGELKAVKLSGRALISPNAISEFVAAKEAEEG